MVGQVGAATKARQRHPQQGHLSLAAQAAAQAATKQPPLPSMPVSQAVQQAILQVARAALHRPTERQELIATALALVRAGVEAELQQQSQATAVQAAYLRAEAVEAGASITAARQAQAGTVAVVKFGLSLTKTPSKV